jgi:hypothetical protein
MSVERYSARRHHLNALTAKFGGHAVAGRAAYLRARPSLKNVAVKPAVRAAAKPAAEQRADRLRRLARAETALGPLPKARALRPVEPEACDSATMGGGLGFDPAPACYVVDGATAPTGAATRVRLRSTHKQRQQRLARAEADMRR